MFLILIYTFRSLVIDLPYGFGGILKGRLFHHLFEQLALTCLISVYSVAVGAGCLNDLMTETFRIKDKSIKEDFEFRDTYVFAFNPDGYINVISGVHKFITAWGGYVYSTYSSCHSKSQFTPLLESLEALAERMTRVNYLGVASDIYIAAFLTLYDAMNSPRVNHIYDHKSDMITVKQDRTSFTGFDEPAGFIDLNSSDTDKVVFELSFKNRSYKLILSHKNDESFDVEIHQLDTGDSKGFAVIRSEEAQARLKESFSGSVGMSSSSDSKFISVIYKDRAAEESLQKKSGIFSPGERHSVIGNVDGSNNHNHNLSERRSYRSEREPLMKKKVQRRHARSTNAGLAPFCCCFSGGGSHRKE